LESTEDWKKQTERLHDWGVQIIVVIACINGAVCDVSKDEPGNEPCSQLFS